MRTSTKIYIFIFILLIAALGAGAILLNKKTAVQTPTPQSQEQAKAEQSPATTESVANSPKFFAGRGFGFSYPAEMNASDVPDQEQDTETVLIQNANSGTAIQIYVSPFDESGPITEQRIRKDLRSEIINNPEQINIDGVQALSFQSDTAGKTREVWFNYDHRLYQITTYIELSNTLDTILATWKFES